MIKIMQGVEFTFMEILERNLLPVRKSQAHKFGISREDSIEPLIQL